MVGTNVPPVIIIPVQW